ncbi:hypothetical protein FRC00_002615 [Tulasnella sp. 408]|nr:hypothetical protein FRC00_002615 [Tulasnella sp. 408]
MSYQFSDEELNDFYAYDANRSIRLVAEDEGKPFSRILPKPAGYDEWLERDGTISVADWVSEKRSEKELDVNEIGKKIIKRTLFRTMGGVPHRSSSNRHGGYRRAVAFKTRDHSPYTRPGTPYPKYDILPMAKTTQGVSHFNALGGRSTSNSTQNATASNAASALANTHHSNVLAAENARLRRKLEEYEMLEQDIIQFDEQNGAATPTAEEVTVNMLGLAVNENPTMNTIMDHEYSTNGELLLN